jgi:hypothetical protein
VHVKLGTPGEREGEREEGEAEAEELLKRKEKRMSCSNGEA